MKRILYSIAIAFALSGCIIADDLEVDSLNDTDSSLVLLITFDQQNANDSSGNSYHGVPGGTNFTTNTPSGTGYAYNITSSTDLLRVPYNPFAGITEYSICCWLRDPSQGLIMNTYGNNVDNQYYNFPQFRISDNLLYASFRSYSLGSNFSYDPATVLQDGYWHHVSITATSSSQLLYVDGVLASTQQSSVDKSESSEVHFGGVLSGYAGALMKIDNIRIYSRVLSVSEIGSIISLEE